MKKKEASYIGCGLSFVAMLVLLLLALLFGGCTTTKYVPIVERHTEFVHVHDTIKQSDSIKTQTNTIIREARPEDSAMIAKLGIKLQNNERLLILLQKELQEAKSSKKESHTKDSVRVDSIPKPYPVPAELTKWQRLKVDWGGWAFLGIAVVLIISIFYIIRRYRPLR